MSPARKLTNKISKQRFTIWMDVDLHDFVSRKSYDLGISMGQYVTECMPYNWSGELKNLIQKQKKLDYRKINQRHPEV